MPLGLVSYGSSDEDSDQEEEIQTKQEPPKPIETKKEEPAKEDEISDEEDFIPSVLDEDNEDVIGLSSSKSLFQSLPSISSQQQPEKTTAKNFVDENEDLSTIPKAKTYSEKPDLKAVKPKKKGPVRIMAPSLLPKTEEEPSRPLIKAPSTIKSGLIGLLPPPKSAPSSTSSTTSFKPTSVKPSFVPRSVVGKKPENKAKPSSTQVANHDSDEEDVPFFTMDAQSKASKGNAAGPSSISMSVKANPEASHPRGIQAGAHPSHQYRYDEDSEYSAVTAPYPPPPPAPHQPGQYVPQENQEVLERLAGRSAVKRRKAEEEGLNQIIDVNYDDIKPDEREWLTKALTENEADKPGPKNTIKGERKRKHQITYLAAMAKEREHELKKQWSESAQNRRAAASKYGF